MPIKPLDIKLSSLDKQAPKGVEVVFRLVDSAARIGNRPPPTIGDYTTVEAAQAASEDLRRQGIRHDYWTWWRKDGKHIHKWATLMRGKRRFYRVSVPYVEGITHEMVRLQIHRALLEMAERPKAYTEKSVKVTIDTDANRNELVPPTKEQTE